MIAGTRETIRLAATKPLAHHVARRNYDPQASDAEDRRPYPVQFADDVPSRGNRSFRPIFPTFMVLNNGGGYWGRSRGYW
jgi:hypothetical protein